MTYISSLPLLTIATLRASVSVRAAKVRACACTTRSKNRKKLLHLVQLALAAVLVLGGVSQCEAALSLDAGWNNDDWFGTLPVFTDDSASPVTEGYDFTISVPAILTVTDFANPGDKFKIYDDTTLLATTTPFDGIPFGDGLGESSESFDLALDDPTFDGVQLVLTPASYKLRIEVVSGLDDGSLGVRIDTIPEPSTFALAALGRVQERTFLCGGWCG